MARTQGHGNPDWTRDETILALDLYFDFAAQIPSGSDPKVRELSSLLRRMPFHSIASRKESFRNPAGVAFKLQNIRQVATGKGLANVSEIDRGIWKELGLNPIRTKALAELIKNGIATLQESQDQFDPEFEFVEGRIATDLHQRRERAPGLRRRLLAVRRKGGPLTCEMCSIRSTTTTPDLEDAIFEVHHLVSVASSGERITRLKDVALLCASCHRLLHRAIAVNRRWLSIDAARKICGLNVQ